jgi:ABC-type lipoprotein release transport system permease subunit
MMVMLIRDIPPLDSGTFVAAPLMLAAVAMLATWVPIRRAMRLDRNVVLRQE